MIRYLKILLVALVALWGLIGVVNNLAEPDNVYTAVQDVASMPAFEVGEGPPWATDNPVIIWLGVALIIAGKAAALVFCGLGVLAMLRHAGSAPAQFQASKAWAILGCGAALAMLFGGFTVIGEGLFLMVLDPASIPAGAAAFRYGGFIGLIMIFVAQRE